MRSNFLPIANLVSGTATDDNLKNKHWVGHRIKELLTPEYQRQLNVLGGSLILQAKGKYESMASAENAVIFLKYSLKSSNTCSSLKWKIINIRN